MSEKFKDLLSVDPAVADVEEVAEMIRCIKAALALHVPFEKRAKRRGKRYCHHCDPDYDVGMIEYPCPTVKALRGEK